MNRSAVRLTSIVLVAGLMGMAGCQKRSALTPDQTAMGPGDGSLAMRGGGDLGAGLGPDGMSAGDTGLENRTGPLDPTKGERGAIASVLFDYDRAEVKSSERAKIEAAAQFLKANPGSRMLLEGHCDWRGTTEYNLGLGDRRANSVKSVLTALGVEPDRTEILSKGDADAREGASEAQMVQDRRVEFVVYR